ncbi:uncharacterized protein [Manis javanica]|uniref:uncharacterized protein isoform X2 n=1 Tax=Manis javanica TaxID=9974 RepID=UPI003C6D7D19
MSVAESGGRRPEDMDVGTVVLGKLESGSICKGQQLVMMPNKPEHTWQDSPLFAATPSFPLRTADTRIRSWQGQCWEDPHGKMLWAASAPPRGTEPRQQEHGLGSFPV